MHVSVRKVGALPAVTSRLSAVALRDGRVLALGGLVRGSSSDEILLGPPARLRLVGHLPAAAHAAAAAPFEGKIGLFGGGEAVSTNTVTIVDPRNGRARSAGHLDAGRGDSNVYAIDPVARAVRKLGRLPRPVAHAPLVALAGALFLVGGTSSTGPGLRTIWRIDPRSGAARAAGALPVPLEDAAAVSLGGRGIVLRGGTAAVYQLTPR